MGLKLLLLAFVLTSGCVKDEGAVSAGDSSSGGDTTGGSSTGNPSTGSDPLAGEAWHLHNSGVSSYTDFPGTLDEDSSIQEVHDMGIYGKGVKVVVSDTGTQLDHEDLEDNALSATLHRNYTFDTPASWEGSSPLPSDSEAHGTAVTGLISALGWNNIGSRGVAPSSKFASFRFIYDRTNSGETVASYLAKEIHQLYGDFDVFNFSYGYDGKFYVVSDPSIEDALQLGTTSLRSGKGTLYVQSAGNSYYEYNDDLSLDVWGNANSHSDQATPYKIIVGAINADGEKSSYSSPGANLWVSAPGGEDGETYPAMMTTDITGCNAGYSYKSLLHGTYFNFGDNTDNPRCDYTNVMNGTSSAAPVTSGVIALMLEARPQLTWRDVKHILAETADIVDFDPLTNTMSHPGGFDLFAHDYDYKWTKNGGGANASLTRNQTGYYFSNWYGFGRVNAKAAVDMAKTYDLSTLGTFAQTKHSSGTWFYSSGTLTGQTIPDQSFIGLENSIWVGHNYVIENVQVELNIDHDFAGELAIVLQSPNLTESRLMTINNRIYSEDGLSEVIMASNAFYGETSEGWWTIKIYDGDSLVGSGELVNWKININGHRKSTDLLKPLPPTFLTLGTVPATIDRTPTFAFTHSLSIATLTRYDARVERASDGAVIQDWTSIGLTNSGNQFFVGLVSGETYNLKVRAVNASGTSSIQLKQWTAN